MTKQQAIALNEQLKTIVAIKNKRIEILELLRDKMILEQAAAAAAYDAAKARVLLATIK